MFHTPAGDREGERKRDPDGDGERERGREICHPRTPTDDRERERKRESIGIRGILAGSLSVSCQREMPSVGFDRIRQETQTTSPDPAGNPDDLARSGRNCLDFTDPTLSDPAIPSRSRHPCESSNPKRKNPFDPKQIQKLVNSILLH
jgi:hypothetical protein